MLTKLHNMDYKAYVEGMAINPRNEVFFNSGPIHASIVMSRIFKYAQVNICIYSGGFTGAVSNDEDYLKYMESFLKKDGRLKIVVEKDLSHDENCRVYELLRRYKSKVDIKKTTARVISIETKKPLHFTVSGNNMMRLETGTDDYTAEVNFGDTKNAPRLRQMFDEIWDDQTSSALVL